jgi:F-type H+-transporting ATPase subunit c
MKCIRTLILTLSVLFLSTAPSMAQYVAKDAAEAARIASAGQPKHGFSDLRPIGVALVILGAAIGIGWLTRSAVESMARQPEVAANIQTAMIISAALIEGVTFFALIILMLFVAPF